MFLTEASVLHYLLDRRFADLESVVRGAFDVRNLSRRNRNYRVTCGAREYFIKQPKRWDMASRRSLEREAGIYWRARTEPGFAPLRALVPESYGYDPVNSVLTLQYLPGQSNLHRMPDRFSPAVARLAGATMGVFHREMRALADGTLFSRRKPWYLAIHQTGADGQADWSEGRKELVRVIQDNTGFACALDGLREEWREETAIHGDWKLENCLLSDTGGRMQVIDWEFAAWGDPFEDIGTMLQSYWGAWVRRPRQYAIEEIRPALHAFLEGYAGDSCQAAGMAPRALRFGAARMLQSAYEALDEAEELNADAVCLLQASLNMFTRPDWALAEIFGAGWG